MRDICSFLRMIEFLKGASSYINICIYISGPVGKEVRQGTPAPPAGCRGPVCWPAIWYGDQQCWSPWFAEANLVNNMDLSTLFLFWFFLNNDII